MGRAVSRLLALVVGAMLAQPAAKAIPEQEALDKLSVIPVHLLVDAKGVPLPIPNKTTLLLPLYLDRQRAQGELQRIRSSHPDLQVQLATLPLSQANAVVAGLKKDLKPGYTLSAPVVPRRQDLVQATVLLRQQGLSDSQIKQGLTVPIFFTRPFLTSQTPQGERGLLFVSYADLQQALSSQPSPPRRVEAADITAILHRLMQTPQDLFVFLPPQARMGKTSARPIPPPPPLSPAP